MTSAGQFVTLVPHLVCILPVISFNLHTEDQIIVSMLHMVELSSEAKQTHLKFMAKKMEAPGPEPWSF